MRSATTGTFEIPRRRRWLSVVAAILAAAAVGVIAFFAVTAARDKARPAGAGNGSAGSAGLVGPPSDAASPPDSRAGDVPHDAPGSPALDAAISIDAAVASAPADTGAPPPDAGTPPGDTSHAPLPQLPPPPPHSVDKRLGTLQVNAMPVLTVTVDGKLYGDTPKVIKLKPGKHRVQLRNSANDTTEVLSGVMITENQLTTIERMPK